MSDLTYWIAKGHLFIDDSCKQDMKLLPGMPFTKDLSTITEDTRLQQKHVVNLAERRHPKYRLHLLCMNTAVLDEKDWNTPLQLRCYACGNTYTFTQDMYEEEKSKTPTRRRR